MVIGASISNFGTSMKLSGIDTRAYESVAPAQLGTTNQVPYVIDLDSWNLPLLFRIGVSTDAVKNNTYRWTIAVDALHPNDDYEKFEFRNRVSLQRSPFLYGRVINLYILLIMQKPKAD